MIDRVARLALESGRPVAQVARDLGIGQEALRKRVEQAEVDGGLRPDLPTSEEREEIRKLRKEVFELRRANEILKAASGIGRDRARRRPADVSAFIDEHRERFGVEPICEVLDVSASAYYQRRCGERSARSVEDERLTARIREVHEQNFEAYGYPRLWHELRRQGEQVGGDRVARLMRCADIEGAKRRGKPWRTTISKPEAIRAVRLPGLFAAVAPKSWPAGASAPWSSRPATCARSASHDPEARPHDGQRARRRLQRPERRPRR